MTRPDVEVERVGRDPVEVAQHLLALTILRSRMTERIEDLRADVAEWAPGATQPVVLPNPDNPRRPFKAGTVRCDQGKVTARVDDADAFEAWVREHAPQNVVIEAARLSGSDTAPAGLPGDLRAAYQAALISLSGPFPMEPEEALWRAIRRAGWTVERAQQLPERVYVQPGYVEAVMRLSREAEEPCAPGGLIPAGVTVETAPAHAYVLPTKDGAIADGFIETARRGQLVATASDLLGGAA